MLPEGENSVTSQWQYQVRFDVNDSATAESIRRQAPDTALAQLFEILARHRALPKCQFDAFAEYVEAAEEQSVESYPLYVWTKAPVVRIGRDRRHDRPSAAFADISAVEDGPEIVLRRNQRS